MLHRPFLFLFTVFVIVASVCVVTPACAPTKQVIHDVKGCSAADLSGIVVATGKLTYDLTAVFRTPDERAAAAVDAIAQLSTINALWAKCKATANADELKAMMLPLVQRTQAAFAPVVPDDLRPTEAALAPPRDLARLSAINSL